MKDTWIFQADPDQCRIDDFLATSPETCLWRVSSGRSTIKIGDKVYLWRSISGSDRARAGIVAQAEIVGPVAKQRDVAASKPFWINRTNAEEIINRVPIRITSADQQIIYDDMKNDPVLSNMQIIRAGIGTNFLLKNEYASRLASLWSKNGQCWDRNEIIAALLAYDCCTEHVQLAITVGRTTSDVRKKLASLQNLDPTSAHASVSAIWSLEKEVWDEFFDNGSMKLRRADLKKAHAACTH